MADTATNAFAIPFRGTLRIPNGFGLPLIVAAIFAAPISIRLGLPISPLAASVVSSVVAALLLVVPAIVRRHVATGASVYPPTVLASVRTAAVVGYREVGGSWTVDVRLTGLQCRMTEFEFQDLARSACPDRTVAAVQRIGGMIYVQHIADGTTKALKHRTEVFDLDGRLGA